MLGTGLLMRITSLCSITPKKIGKDYLASLTHQSQKNREGLPRFAQSIPKIGKDYLALLTHQSQKNREGLSRFAQSIPKKSGRITSLRSVIREGGPFTTIFNSQPYKSELLTTALLKIVVGRAGFEPAKVKTNRFTVCPRWPLEYLPKAF